MPMLQALTSTSASSPQPCSSSRSLAAAARSAQSLGGRAGGGQHGGGLNWFEALRWRSRYVLQARREQHSQVGAEAVCR